MCVDGGCGTFTDVDNEPLEDQDKAKAEFEALNPKEQDKLRKEQRKRRFSGPDEIEIPLLGIAVGADMLESYTKEVVVIALDAIKEAIDKAHEKDLNSIGVYVALKEFSALLYEAHANDNPHPLNEPMSGVISAFAQGRGREVINKLVAKRNAAEGN